MENIQYKFYENEILFSKNVNFDLCDFHLPKTSRFIGL